MIETAEELGAYKAVVLEALTFLLDEREQTCDVCYTSLVGAEKFTITRSCFHYFCKECIRDYLTTKISQGRVLNIACPSSGCKASLGRAELVDSGASEEVVKKYDEFVFSVTVEKEANTTWCPFMVVFTSATFLMAKCSVSLNWQELLSYTLVVCRFKSA